MPQGSLGLLAAPQARRQHVCRVLERQVVRLGHRSGDQLAAEGGQPLAQYRVGRSGPGHSFRGDLDQVGEGGAG
jgi:hypothetical protein